MPDPAASDSAFWGSDEAWRENYVAQVNELASRFEDTHNPLFAWFALALIVEFNAKRTAKAEDQGAPHTPLAPIEMPRLVASYFGRTASKLIFTVGEKVFGGEMTAKEAAEEIPAMLGFVRKGWNAIDELARHNDARASREVFERFKSLGYPTHDAMTEALQEAGITDRRALQKRWASLKRRPRGRT